MQQGNRQTKTVDEVLMDALVADYQKRGSPAILDRCYDRTFCQVLGFKYSDKYIYSRIEQTLMAYMLPKDETNPDKQEQ